MTFMQIVLGKTSMKSDFVELYFLYVFGLSFLYVYPPVNPFVALRDFLYRNQSSMLLTPPEKSD